MKITVNEQPQQFQLAMKNRWVPAVGHGINVGEYQFCACPIGSQINVSEVTTGANLMNVPVDTTVNFITESKAGTIDYLYIIGKSIKRLINKNDIDTLINSARVSADRLGKMPEIEYVEVGQ